MPSIPREHRKGQFLALPFARFPDTKRMQYNTKRHARTRVDPYQRPAKVFLLSPALLTGARAKQLLSPCSFAGVGDMSRGALMLRAARSGEELDYDSVESMLFKMTGRRRR